MVFLGSSIDQQRTNPHRHDWEGGGSLIFKLANSPQIDGYLPLVGSLGNYDGSKLDEVLSKADQNLYRDKRQRKSSFPEI